ncbi:MAG: Lrp/AsnC family transcriptional regulator [Pseudomonadota bacterium]
MKYTFKMTALDRKVLAELQHNCRLSNQDIAERVGSSASSVWRRIRTMEEAGVIGGFHVAVTAEALGYAEIIMVHVCLSKHSDKGIDAFTQLVDNAPEVLECYAVTGDHDFLLKVLAKDMRAFYRFLEETLMNKDYIDRTSSTVVMNKIKESRSVPV